MCAERRSRSAAATRPTDASLGRHPDAVVIGSPETRVNLRPWLRPSQRLWRSRRSLWLNGRRRPPPKITPEERAAQAIADAERAVARRALLNMSLDAHIRQVISPDAVDCGTYTGRPHRSGSDAQL